MTDETREKDDAKPNGQGDADAAAGAEADAPDAPAPEAPAEGGGTPDDAGEGAPDPGEAGDVAALLARVAELEDECLRAKAATENVRKRMEEKAERDSVFAVSSFARALLDVRDALAAALSSKDSAKENLVEGVELTLKKLDSTLEGERIRRIEALGARFDPELHDAMGTRETDEVEPQTVCEVVVEGFTISGRVLRPAMVIVAQSPKTGGPRESGDDGAT